MRKIIQRYLAINFIPPFLMTLTFIVSFLLTFQLFRLVRLVISKGVGIPVVLELIFHISVSFLPMAFPLAVLFASIYTLGKISSDSEFIIMRSLGFSKWRLYTPFFILSLMISMLIYGLYSSYVPYSQKQLQRSVAVLTSSGVLADIQKAQFFTDIPGVTLFAENVKNKGFLLENVFIRLKNPNSVQEKVLFAKEGQLIKNGESKWGMAALSIKLINGNITKIDKEKNNAEKILFESYEFPITEAVMMPSAMEQKTGMQTNQELYRLITLPKEKRQKIFSSTEDFIKAKLEFFDRINTPLICIVFMLVGFSLGVQKTRGRTRNSTFFALVVLCAYYSLYFGGVGMAKKGHLEPAIATFVPTLICFLSGLYFFRTVD